MQMNRNTIIFPSTIRVSKTKSNFIDTESTEQTSTTSEKAFSSSGKLNKLFCCRPKTSSITNTASSEHHSGYHAQLFHTAEPSDIDVPPISILQNEIDKPSDSAITPHLKTVSDSSSEIILFLTFSSFLSTSSVDEFLNCESEDSQTINTLTYSAQRILILITWDQHRFNHCLRLVQERHQFRSVHYCVITRNLRHLPLKIVFLFSPIIPFHCDFDLVIKFFSLWFHTQNLHILLEIEKQSPHWLLSVIQSFHISLQTKTLDLLQLVHNNIQGYLLFKKSILPDKICESHPSCKENKQKSAKL